MFLRSEASRLSLQNKKSTISSQEIQTAFWLLLPGELAKQGVSECTEAVTKYTSSTPSMELTLSWWGGLSTKKFQAECVNEKSSTERRS